MTDKYSIENARASIRTRFSFRNHQNIRVADLEGINERLKECERRLSIGRLKIIGENREAF